MPVTLTNRWKQLLVVRLNSGRAVHLAPGEVVRGLEELEVNDNADVAKMVQRGLLALERPAAPSGEAGRR